MKKYLSNLRDGLKLYGKAPEVTSLLALLALTAVIVIADAFFLPNFLKIITIVVFLGVAVILTSNNLRLLRSRIDAKLKTNELQAVIGNVQDGIIVYDTNYKIIAANPATETITGLKTGELIGEKITPSFVNNPRFKIISQIMFPSLASSATQISSEAWPQVVDISIEEPFLKIRTNLNRVLDEDGKMVGFLKIIQDQTREKDILESKNEFVAITSHQLRTPLTAIHWAFEHLQKNLESKPELNEVVNEGLKLSTQVLKTINDLLDVTKIERGKFGYKLEKISLSEFIRGVLSQAELMAKERQVKIGFDAPAKEYSINIDPQKLGMALANLIENAIKYNVKNGEVTVSVEEPKDRPFLKINVSDTGIGIPKEEINKLFTKFYRGENITQMEPNGNGLGLFIAKNIIQNHGGEIGVESTPGRGSTFYFTLPLKSEAAQ